MRGAVRELVGSRELLRTLVERQVRLRAKRTIAGVVWPVLAPMFLLALYAFVFHSVFKVPIHRYPVFLFSALLPWSFLAQTLGSSISSLSNEPELIRRSRFPYEYLPIASAMTFFLYFLATLTLFVGYLSARGVLAFHVLPVIVLPILALFLFVTALTMALALIDVYNRDLRQVLGNVLTVWFFLVPIVYRPEMAHGWLRRLRSVDPMNLIIGQFRDILYWGKISRPAHMGLMSVVCVFFFLTSLTVFRWLSAELPKNV